MKIGLRKLKVILQAARIPFVKITHHGTQGIERVDYVTVIYVNLPSLLSPIVVDSLNYVGICKFLVGLAFATKFSIRRFLVPTLVSSFGPVGTIRPPMPNVRFVPLSVSHFSSLRVRQGRINGMR